ncbi:Transcriptional activator somA [Penicillium verhagenii]|uniref:Transcriptional activator somA n=1 Tax=Penicillium verhagenii TaxID=1562060 RepID=UPI002544E492|nr:Transcriptional activator somA [Penicillium verhagenii]KAJ5935717.1 Transcriptional activator somA [Penicillium verhagenii]
MNQMNVGMNPGVAGPVGGVPMMNNGSSAPRNDGTMNNPDNLINNLNTYIYDYFLKRGYHDCARALLQDENIKLNTDSGTKPSPGNRRDDVNGMDGDAMMTDGKDGEKIKIPDDLPRPTLVGESLQSSFLLEWFSLFWDFFWAQRKKGSNHDVRQYLQHTQVRGHSELMGAFWESDMESQNMMRMREQQQNHMIRPQQPMMPAHMNPMMRQRNGMGHPNLAKAALQHNNPLTQQQILQLQQQQKLQVMQQMREQASMDEMNGNRPQSPASTDNAPSPSKKPRLEGHPNGQQLAPGGRGQGQGMPVQNPQQMMMPNMPNGMNPRINQQFQFTQGPSVPAQQKNLQVKYAQDLASHHTRSALNYQGIPNGGMMNPGVMPNQGDLVQMPDGQGMYPMGTEYYANGQLAQVRPGMAGTPNGQHGNHALQDYQMQLMLLEQQNKRRLMMARQEQDTMSRDGQQMPGQGGLPPGTSPQGSRTGASPNPSDQMKRGTPKMPQSGLPGSPSAADLGQNRGSPGSMHLNGQMGADMGGQFFGGPGSNMRPPSSNPSFNGPQMGQPITANTANRVPSGQWPPGQMPPQHSPATQPQVGTPQERGNMPPPQAPPTAGGNAGRAQESPAGSNAPPTPQPPSKPAPKKRDKKTTAKGGKKGQGAPAAASAEATDPAQTPNPPTPVTPHPPNNTFKGGANANNAGPPPQQPSAPAPPPMVQSTPDQSQQYPAEISITDNTPFNLDFSALDNPDILESFDFDTFLNTDAAGTDFGFDPSMPYNTDGVETGAGDGL